VPVLVLVLVVVAGNREGTLLRALPHASCGKAHCHLKMCCSAPTEWQLAKTPTFLKGWKAT